METVLEYLLAFGIVGVLLTQITAIVRSVVGSLITRSRERTGLMRLLYVEVAQNEPNIAYVATELERPDAARYALAMRGRYVNAEVWKAVRVSLSQSISSKHFAVLSDYYKNVLLLEEVVTEEREKKDRKKDREQNHETSSDIIYKTKVLVRALQEQEGKVQEVIRTQVPDVTASDRYAELLQTQALAAPPGFKNRR
jgi:hypothetical protein